MQQVTNQQIQSQLIERLMGQLQDKNAYLTELTNQKMQIESKMRGQIDSATITDMQRQLEDLTAEFERVITERIE